MKQLFYSIMVASILFVGCKTGTKKNVKQDTEKSIENVTKITENNGSIQLLRNATLVIDFGGKKILVDPMFADKGEFDPFPFAGNEIRNPMVDLPISKEEVAKIVDNVDAVFITHTHLDHWDPKAQQMIDKHKPIFCQPSDEKTIKDQGFTNVMVLNDKTDWEGITVHKTGGQHGFGKLGELMGSVSGYVFSHNGKSIYIAGDTRWCKEVKTALDTHKPDVIVLNAGGAQFIEGDLKGEPITMTPEDIIAVYENSQKSNIITVHMNTLNHCHVKRKDLKKALTDIGIAEVIEIPADGDIYIIK